MRMSSPRVRLAQIGTRRRTSVDCWHNSRMSALPKSIDDTLALLARADYVAERSLATAVFLALKMGRPLFLEGEAGVGKTEIAKVLSSSLGRRLLRLQC